MHHGPSTLDSERSGPVVHAREGAASPAEPAACSHLDLLQPLVDARRQAAKALGDDARAGAAVAELTSRREPAERRRRVLLCALWREGGGREGVRRGPGLAVCEGTCGGVAREVRLRSRRGCISRAPLPRGGTLRASTWSQTRPARPPAGTSGPPRPSPARRRRPGSASSRSRASTARSRRRPPATRKGFASPLHPHKVVGLGPGDPSRLHVPRQGPHGIQSVGLVVVVQRFCRVLLHHVAVAQQESPGACA